MVIVTRSPGRADGGARTSRRTAGLRAVAVAALVPMPEAAAVGAADACGGSALRDADVA
jgi:hypothetical protein